MSGVLEAIIAHGNRPAFHPGEPFTRGENVVRCADGFKVSVVAGVGCYCSPRPDWPLEWGGVDEDYPGPYTHVEVGYPSVRPQPWGKWRRWAEDPNAPTGTVYSQVPVAAVRRLVAAHGGEA